MSFFKHFLIGKLFLLISNLINFIKTKSLIGETFYSEGFIVVIKQYLNVDLRKDWIGRLYGVANPYLNKDGNFEISKMIIEIDGENTNNTEYIRSWVYRQMTLIAQLFKIEKLYDYINVDFKHIGPDNQDNYLLIFDIVARKELFSSLKKFLLHLFIYFILFCIFAFIYTIFKM